MQKKIELLLEFSETFQGTENTLHGLSTGNLLQGFRNPAYQNPADLSGRSVLYPG
jgi:hypothetical protein